jgi:hypothetical protein
LQEQKGTSVKKGFASMMVLLCAVASAHAAEVPARQSVFSTSTDWESVTGMRLMEYRLYFGRDRTIGNVGAELYFLDGFPCYAQSENVRSWVSPSWAYYDVDKDTFMRIVCLAAPMKVNLAYREAKRETPQGKTTGVMTCKTERTGRDLTVNLSACDTLVKWEDYK